MARGEVDQDTNSAVMDEVVIATPAGSANDCKRTFMTTGTSTARLKSLAG